MKEIDEQDRLYDGAHGVHVWQERGQGTESLPCSSEHEARIYVRRMVQGRARRDGDDTPRVLCAARAPVNMNDT